MLSGLSASEFASLRKDTVSLHFSGDIAYPFIFGVTTLWTLESCATSVWTQDI